MRTTGCIVASPRIQPCFERNQRFNNGHSIIYNTSSITPIILVMEVIK